MLLGTMVTRHNYCGVAWIDRLEGGIIKVLVNSVGTSRYLSALQVGQCNPIESIHGRNLMFGLRKWRRSREPAILRVVDIVQPSECKVSFRHGEVGGIMA